MKKAIRFISAALAVIMVLSSVFFAYGQEKPSAASENTAVCVINTARGAINPADYNLTEDEAAAQIRDGLVKRQSPIEATFVSSRLLNGDDYKRIFTRAYSMDLARNSSEGDYLRWSFRSYTFNIRALFDSVAEKYYYTFSIEVDYFTTLAQENEVNTAVAAAIKSLNLDSMVDYEKVLAIGNYICEINNYDYEHYQNTNYYPQFTAYGAIHNGVSVCQGYCALFYKMCVEVGIPCRIIASTDHTWNLVKLTDYGDYYYNIDVTWNDTAHDNPDASHGNYWSNDYVHDYSLKSNADFAATHVRTGEYATAQFEMDYPVAPVSFYLYEKNEGTQTHKVYCADCKGLVSEAEKCTIVNSRCIYCEALPSKPMNVRTTARGGTGERLKIEWNIVANADGYNVYILKDGKYTYVASTEDNEYIFDNLVPGWEYYFKVSAYNGEIGNEGPLSDELHTCAACPPMEIPSVNAVNGKTIQVDWNTTNAHGYVVQWSTDKNFKTNVNSAYVVGQAKNSYTITVSGNAQNYYVRTRAWRYWEDNTLVYGIWTDGIKSGEYPAKVTGVYTAARGGTGERLRIEWDSQANADSYNVYRLTDGEYKLYDTTTDTGYVFADLVPGWEYYFKVSAVKNGVEGLLSDELHTCAACPPMDAPSVSRSGSQIKVNWDIVNSHGYVVMWSTDPSFATGTSYAYVTGHEKNTYTITGINANQAYYVRVRAWRYWENNTLVYGIWTDGVKA